MKKPRARTRKPRADLRLLLDQTLRCCDHIETVAGLLRACGCDGGSEPLPAQVAASTGYLIGDEARQLRHLLNQFLMR